MKAKGYVDACRRELWHLQLWKKTESRATAKRVPFRCRSWRHEGPCREWCGACDFLRCKQAIESRTHWSFLTLTFEHRKWSKSRLDLLFREGYHAWNRVRRRLVDESGHIKYIQTWEIHRSEYPHAHVVISNENVFRHACAVQAWKRAYMIGTQPWKLNWLEPMLQECGFGTACDLKPVHEGVGMAGYLAKMAKELTGAGYKSQIPVNAPRHFRRLRASKGLLPKRYKDKDLTGTMVKVPIDEFDLDGLDQDK